MPVKPAVPRILFINSHEPDYLQDLSYSGLQKLFGPEAVYCYPFNKAYAYPVRKYPRNLGFNHMQWVLPYQPKPDPSRFDFVFIGSCKPLAFEAYLSLAEKIPANVPVVFIDGGDYPAIGGDMARLHGEHLYKQALSLRPFSLIFKRELLRQTYPEHRAAHIHPLPFSFNYSYLPHLPVPEKYQVSFWAVESDPVRTHALDLLQNRFDCRENGTVRNQVFKKYKRKGLKYLAELAACRITLNLRGGGWDTMRYWEAPAVGSLMISGRPAIEIPDNFIENEEVIFCADDLSDLVPLCEQYLADTQARNRIAAAGARKAALKHSDLSRAEYMAGLLGIAKV